MEKIIVRRNGKDRDVFSVSKTNLKVKGLFQPLYNKICFPARGTVVPPCEKDEEFLVSLVYETKKNSHEGVFFVADFQKISYKRESTSILYENLVIGKRTEEMIMAGDKILGIIEESEYLFIDCLEYYFKKETVVKSIRGYSYKTETGKMIPVEWKKPSEEMRVFVRNLEDFRKKFFLKLKNSTPKCRVYDVVDKEGKRFFFSEKEGQRSYSETFDHSEYEVKMKKVFQINDKKLFIWEIVGLEGEYTSSTEDLKDLETFSWEVVERFLNDNGVKIFFSGVGYNESWGERFGKYNKLSNSKNKIPPGFSSDGERIISAREPDWKFCHDRAYIKVWFNEKVAEHYRDDKYGGS